MHLVLDQEGSFLDVPEGLPDAESREEGFLGAGQAECLGGGADLVGFLAVDDADLGVGEQAGSERRLADPRSPTVSKSDNLWNTRVLLMP
ncbi:MAG: hypothetical protein ACK5MT_03860 [Actinomycetales bacterium]